MKTSPLKIAVGELTVSDYISVNCPKHTWDLAEVPITNCPYYLCLAHNNERAYHDYMALWAKRHPKVIADYPYEGYFMPLVAQIRADGGYVEAKGEKQPMWVWKRTMWLGDGHRRAAILCALLGKEYVVSVIESDRQPPTDHNQCSNPCVI